MNCNTTRSHPLYFYSRPCGRGDIVRHAVYPIGRNFYSRPCGRGDWIFRPSSVSLSEISTHAPAGGATLRLHLAGAEGAISTHAPAGGATSKRIVYNNNPIISTHAPAGGATGSGGSGGESAPPISTHAPAGGATCSRKARTAAGTFLLTPLREGRPYHTTVYVDHVDISTHAPAGGATSGTVRPSRSCNGFLLTPLREGRPGRESIKTRPAPYFYSRPCGRGDSNFPQVRHEVLRQIAER